MTRMTKAVLPLLSALVYSSRAGAFTMQPRICSRSLFARTAATSKRRSNTEMKALPTIEQLSNDPFMKQVSHASEIVPLLSADGQDENNEISAMLQAQLSHSDGIRGFFVNYLTGEGETAADASEVPVPLASAIQTVSDREDLVSLASMNVIMPTAMSSMHTDPALQQSSTTTAKRGIKVLNYLAKLAPDDVKPTCDAIMAATVGVETDEDNVNVVYWRKFFANYGYEAQQLTDISSAIATIEC